MKLTHAERRALKAVKEGKCSRRYHEKGNAMVPPEGISRLVLRQLERLGLIKDGPGVGNSCTLVPTRRGEESLTEI